MFHRNFDTVSCAKRWCLHHSVNIKSIPVSCVKERPQIRFSLSSVHRPRPSTIPASTASMSTDRGNAMRYHTLNALVIKSQNRLWNCFSASTSTSYLYSSASWVFVFRVVYTESVKAMKWFLFFFEYKCVNWSKKLKFSHSSRLRTRGIPTLAMLSSSHWPVPGIWCVRVLVFKVDFRTFSWLRTQLLDSLS